MSKTITFEPGTAADRPSVTKAPARRDVGDDKGMLRAVADLTRDLNVPRSAIYWADLLGSSLAGYAALFIAMSAKSTTWGLLAGLVAQSRSPGDYAISAEATSVEPYGIMVRKDDKAFKAVVDKAMSAVYTSGQINAIYSKWFEKPVPPKNINLALPMPAAFKKVVAKPTDSGDPKAYE